MLLPQPVLFACLVLRSALRDRVLYMLFGTGVVVLVLLPALSLFSMRQVQELAVTLSLSILSLFLLITAVLQGAYSIWGDIESRYAASILGLPVSRAAYIWGKFLGIVLFLALSTLCLSLAGAVVISVAASQYPAEHTLVWSAFAWTVVFLFCKYVLVAAIALLFSAISTSFFLPIFGTLSIYLAGSASQDVMMYLQTDQASHVAHGSKIALKVLYYLLPNLSAFDLHVYAIYSLPLPPSILLSTLLYFLFYTALVCCIAAWAFGKRALS
ncbi:MAG: ABC transporter permease [Desulfobulbus sp.]